jgi:hypothetical protein
VSSVDYLVVIFTYLIVWPLIEVKVLHLLPPIPVLWILKERKKQIVELKLLRKGQHKKENAWRDTG